MTTRKLWIASLKLLALMAFGVWLLITYSVAREIGQPFAGFRYEESLSVSPQNDLNWNGPRAGLTAYDRLLSANDEPLRVSSDLKRIVTAHPLGTPITYAVLRGDRLMSITVTTQVLSGQDFARAFLPTLLAGLLHLLVGAWAFWLRPTHAAAQAHLLLTISVGIAYQVLGVDFTMAGWLTPFYLGGVWFIGANALHLAMVFPSPLPIVRHRTWTLVLPYVPAALGAAAAIASYRPISYVLARSEPSVIPELLPIWALWTLLAFALVFVRMLYSGLAGTSERSRQQARLVLVGIVAGYLPGILVYLVPVMRQSSMALSIGALSLAYSCFLLFPLTVAYAVLRHQLFGITRAVKKTLTYAAVTGCLGALYFLLLEGTRAWLGLHSQSANLLAILTLTLIFAPLYQRIQALIDRLFARTSLRAQQVAAEFGQEAQNERDPGRLLDLFARKTQEFLDPELIAAYLRRGDAELALAARWGSAQDLPAELVDHPPTTHGEPARAILGGCLAISEGGFCLPLVVQGESIGCLVIGKSRAGHHYEESERLFLVTMAQQLAVWLKNAQLFEHLARRNEELSQANQHLQELDRLKGDFLNAASHELRTPLASIMGYSEFLEDGLGGEPSARQLEYIQQIQNGAKRLLRLVDDLLDFARLEAGNFNLDRREVDLREIIQEVAASLVPQATTQGASLRLELSEAPLRAPVDLRRIEQVLLNLVGNALKFTPVGGVVTIAAAHDSEGVRIGVRDTGIGIPEDQLPLLFQKFFQVDPGSTRSYGGTGLGLSIVKALVEAHGGEIGVESRLGSGSHFWFRVPAPPEAEPASTTEAAMTAP
jgi:signal transduction histidine kinase